MFQKTFSAKMLSDNVCVICLVHLLILLALTKGTAETRELRPPALDFNKHRLVQPIVHHGRTKREISTTRDTSGAHHSEVTVTVPIDGQEYVLDLRLNQDLVTDNHVLRYQKNGKTVVYKPKKEDIDLCQYSGTVRGKPGSWVAVSTCHGVRGTVFDGERMKYIEPAEGTNIQSNHYIYDHSDLNNEYHCGYVGGVTNNSSYDPQLHQKYHSEQDRQRSRISRYKRYAPDDTEVHGPYNANKLSRYVELVLVADNREFKANGENVQTVYRQMKDVANIINSVYSPLNIFIALVGVVVWTESDQIVLEETGDKTLYNFLEYRKSVLLKDIPNDNAQLVTRQKYNEGVIGKGTVGSICTNEWSGGVSTNHSKVIGLMAATIAHEMGHNFGMLHDTDELCCPDAKCIMSTTLSYVPATHWSSCSLKSLALTFARREDNCLRNKPKRLFDSPTCGNGFTEPGEQCDCGTMADPRSYNPCHACCNPDTCMLRANATCGAGMCCDLQTCRLKSAGTVCRSADRECDLPEYCTGHSEYCPDDFYKMDTTQCGKDGRMCYKEQCVRASSIRHTIATMKTSDCPSNCSGRGVCNSAGHCHCEAGFAPPLCDLPGPGGSYDSGPATDPTIQRNFMVAMYVIFLGIIPSILLVLFLIDSRPNILLWWKKPRKSYEDNLCNGCTKPNMKSMFADKFAKFQDSTSYLRNLLSFKRNGSAHSFDNICTDPPQPEGPIYSNLEELKAKQKPSNAISLPAKNVATIPLKKPVKRITKDDIQIANNTDIKVNRPSVKPKPNLSHLPQGNKPDVVIIMQGLASTTNEMVANSQLRMHNVDNNNSSLHGNVGKFGKNGNFGGNANINAIFLPDKNVAKVPLKKPVKEINKDNMQIENNIDIKVNSPPVKPKPNFSNLPQRNKPNVVIIKQGLASTINEMVANSQHRMHNVDNNNSSLHGNVGKYGKNGNFGGNANINAISLTDKNIAKVPLKKPVKKINKDDTQIANVTDIKVNRPPIKPKPNLSQLPQENKPNVVNNSSLHGNVGKFGENGNVGGNANVHRFKK